MTLVFLLLTVACKAVHPVDFLPGDYSCDHCRMHIVDMRFKTEAISPKGKIFHFDSIECLLDWKKKHPEKIASAWVTDFYHPERWIDFTKARFLKSKNLPSPMGGFLSAYGSEADLQKAKQEFGGEETIYSIQEAIQKAHAGDLISIPPGFYQEATIQIDKPLTLKGVGRVVIDGGHQGHVILVRSGDVVLENLTIQNSGASDISEFAGIRVEEGHRCVIRKNRFLNNTYAVYLAKVDGCEVTDNTIQGAAQNEVSGGNGVHLWHSRNIHIADNTVRGHRDGLYLEFTEKALVERNRVEDNIRYGLHFMFSHESQYLHNVFSRNQTGVAVMYSRHIRMQDNRFEKSWGRSSYGLLLKDIVDSTIEQNTFESNTVGIYADASNRNTFRNNHFRHNGWAVNLLGSSETNVFESNNFVANYFDVATNTQDPLNRFENNYWAGYRGYDLDHDGLGDVPLRPMKIFSLWVNRNPELIALFGSPVVEFLEAAERIFPVLTPAALQDLHPRMKL